MTERRSLWADPPEDEPEPEPDVVARVLPEEPAEPVAPAPQAPAQPSVSPRALAVGMLAAILIIGLTLARADRGSLFVEDVPSSWGAVPMTCQTARLEQDGRALELFRCRALGNGALPPGVYQSPENQWTSDITRVDARANAMEISRDGVLRGWAAY